MSVLPPTPTRIALARGIAAGEVVHHAWISRPWTCWRRDSGLTQQVVTAAVGLFRLTGLAEFGPADPDDAQQPLDVRLTDAGRAWLQQHGGET